MAYAPIWKDRYVTLATSGNSAAFEIRTGSSSGPVIYTGTAYPRPGETDIYARINDVCADYLRHAFPAPGVRFTASAISETFVTLVGGVQKDSVDFVNDWTYNRAGTFSSGMLLSDPVRPLLDPRQLFIFSVLEGNASVNVTLYFADGTTSTVVVSIATTADFNANDFSDDFAIQDLGSRPGTGQLDLSAFSNLVAVKVKGKRWEVARYTCARFVVYYVNALGGWDSLLLEGNHQRTDALTRHTMTTGYDNNAPLARGRRDFCIERVPSWVLRSGWLADAESLRMHHLLASVDVYLDDLEDGVAYPVVLTDAEAPRKTYRTEGRRMVGYEFNAQLAQERVSR